MGNNNSLANTWAVKFVQNMDDEHFGNVDIYKNQQGQFIMSTRRTYIKSKNENSCQPRLKQMRQFLQETYCPAQSPNTQILTPVLHYTKTEQNNLCIIWEIYDIYSQYLNFTLGDMIKCKKQMDSDQLWLCFKWMIKMAIQFSRKKWSLTEGCYLDKIFLTLKGRLTVYFYDLFKKHGDFEQELQPQEQGKIFTDQSRDKQLEFMYEIALCIVQLACMVRVTKNQNLQLYLRKCSKMDSHLGGLLNQILNNLHKNPNLTLQNLLKAIQQLQTQKKITIANSVKLNKFRYAIPKPEVKNKEDEGKKALQSLANTKINVLNGRKNSSKKLSARKKDNLKYDQASESQHSSNSQNIYNPNDTTKKNILSLLKSKNNNNFSDFTPMKNPFSQTVNFNTKGQGGCLIQRAQSKDILNKDSSKMLLSFKDEISRKKQQIQLQKQRIIQRKQIIMRNTQDRSIQDSRNKNNVDKENKTTHNSSLSDSHKKNKTMKNDIRSSYSSVNSSKISWPKNKNNKSIPNNRY